MPVDERDLKPAKPPEGPDPDLPGDSRATDCWSPALPAALAIARPQRVNCAPQPAPWICPPVRLSDCPTCEAAPGVRCVGFERWDECHFDRFLRCAQQSIGAS